MPCGSELSLTMAGRPRGTFGTPRITKALTKNICDLIEIGMAPRYAAQHEGISERTFRHWMRLAQQAEEKDEQIKSYSDLFAAITRARARCVKRMLMRGHSGEKGERTTALWILEKQFKDEYGYSRNEQENKPVEIVIKGGLPEFPK
jgi:hypothetical protein